MITQIHIQNYKALRDVTLELTQIHVLIGRNDSGKTSILEAFNALCRSVDFQLSQAFVGSWHGQELVWRDAPAPVVSLSITAAEASLDVHYSLSARFPLANSDREATTDREVVEIGTSKVEFPHRTGATAVYNVTRGHWQLGPDEQRSAAAVHTAISGSQAYRWDARLLALPVAPDSARRFRMESSGFGLALCLDDILGFDRDLFGTLETRFRTIFPEVRSIKLLPERAFRAASDASRVVPLLNPADGKGIYFQFEGSQKLVPASQASEGLLLVLAYLTLLHLPEPPRVLLIEEPENGIHPKRLQQVVEILRDLIKSQNRTQVLLTTHSPYMLDLLNPEEVTLCQKEQDGSVSVHRLSESKSVREQLDLFTLGEIWTAEGDEKLAASTGGGGQ
jgi:predicted ATPase